MRLQITLLLLSYTLVPIRSFTQNERLRDLKGRVVEMTEGRPVGIPNLQIGIENFDQDITRTDGSFKLKIPSDKDYVTLVLENSPHKMISPYSGIVNLPPEGSLQVIICGEQNRKLRQEAERLRIRVARLESENDLSKRQTTAMYNTMLDTILYFQSKIRKMETEHTTLTAEMDVKDKRIQELEASQQQLLLEIEEALQAKYLRQKAEFDQIASELLEYLSRLKDLRLRATPPKLTEYFRNRAAIPDLKAAKDAYNAARQEIIIRHQNHVVAVKKNWEDPDAYRDLETTYTYLLKDVHQQQVLPLDKHVFGPLAAYASNQTGRMRAERKAEKAAETEVPKLVDTIHELERKVQTALDSLKKNI